MTRPPRNIGASVNARLLRRARESGEDFQLLLVRFASERLLYRLASSPHAARFVLKGAVLFTIWTRTPHRTTRDVDLLGFGDPSESQLGSILAEILALDVADDGVEFDLDSLEVSRIREEQEYGGLRAVVTASIAAARVRLQVDVGFGDVMTPRDEMVVVPPLLEFPAARLRAYPRETVVSEKVEAMVKLGSTNSRMKDFYDIVILSRTVRTRRGRSRPSPTCDVRAPKDASSIQPADRAHACLQRGRVEARAVDRLCPKSRCRGGCGSRERGGGDLGFRREAAPGCGRDGSVRGLLDSRGRMGVRTTWAPWGCSGEALSGPRPVRAGG